MHIIVLVTIIGIAVGIRYSWQNLTAQPLERAWENTLAVFLLPPLLLFTSALAIVWMGPHGRMVWVGNDWLSYDLAIGFLGIAVYHCLTLARSSWLLIQQVRTYPHTELQGWMARSLDLDFPYIAQIGFWQAELVITPSLLALLSAEELAVVLAHEEAHRYYRDTWWFFWLGWVRQTTSWLPQTEALWQELLTLRELRADRWAAERNDPLLVAEALVSVVRHLPVSNDDRLCVAFAQIAPIDRLSRRIDALLDAPKLTAAPTQLSTRSLAIGWLILALLPLLTVPFHY